MGLRSKKKNHVVGALKLAATPCRVKIKILKTNISYYMEKNRLWHKVSMGKKSNQSDYPSLRYTRKRDGLVCAKPNRRIFAYISSQRGPIDLLLFALKPCALTSYFYTITPMRSRL
jgi:hypothetical protein